MTRGAHIRVRIKRWKSDIAREFGQALYIARGFRADGRPQSTLLRIRMAQLKSWEFSP